MGKETSDNKRIAKNTIMLYIRMGVSMVVGLFTTRIVLQALGVDDYGIYGLVGGIVVFMSFVNGAMSAATGRFIAYELGRDTEGRLKETFISAFWIHIAIALVIMIVAETVGLWFLYNKLVIPPDRMQAAFWVFQFSILTAIVSITQVPYNASVVAHEDLNVFAIVEIINSFVKLGIAYLLLTCTSDRLILYASLLFLDSFIVACYYRIYCLRHYKECHIKLIYDKKITRSMFSFCLWDLYGNLCAVGKDQGLAFIINIFFGVALNAASSIACTVSGILSGFTSNITAAVRPQIIKKYASSQIKSMLALLCNAIKYNILLQACVSIPLIFECNYVLTLWLGKVPPYASVFCQIMLTASILRTAIILLNIAISSTGVIRRVSFYSGSISLIQLPLIYLILKNGGGPEWCYMTSVIGVVVVSIIDMSILKTQVHDVRVMTLLKPYAKAIAISLLFSVIPWVLTHLIEESFFRLILSYIGYSVPLIIFTYRFVLERENRAKVKNYIYGKLFLRLYHKPQ